MRIEPKNMEHGIFPKKEVKNIPVLELDYTKYHITYSLTLCELGA